MLSFQDAVAIIISTLKDFQRSEMLIRHYQTFYTIFYEFLIRRGITDDPSTAYSLWKDENYERLSAHKQKIYSSAANVLLFVIQMARIPYDFFCTLPSKIRLLPAHYKILTEYLEHAGLEFSPSHISNMESRCSVFLFHVQVHGIKHVSNLNYDFLQMFYSEYNYSISVSKGMYLSTVMGFLKYLADRNLVPQAFSLFMDKNRRATLIDISAMAVSDQEALNNRRLTSNKDFPSDEFYASSIDFFETLRNHGYEDTVCSLWKITSESLYLFLHRNNLGYEKVIADIWYSYYNQGISDSNLKMSRRLMKLYQQYVENGDIDPLTIFSYNPSSIDLLPSWCRSTVVAFLNRKEKEQKADSTVSFYRSSVLRFCNWLDKKEVHDFAQITPNHIKQFDIEDPHSTTEGKAAYNSRIRQFLMYLEENSLITGRLFECVPTAYAKRERLVNVLSAEEISILDEYTNKAKEELELRDAAMIQLGLRMGLRAIDVCGLKLEDIDWKGRSIHFIQQKTKVEVHLPMPVCVGNAIYRYLRGRVQRQSAFVFLPYNKRGDTIGPGACREALYRALPEFHRGFHWLRKTFSTGLLNRNVSPATIDDALGHTSDCDRDRYLALKGDRMMLCPLRLTDEGINSVRR